MYFTPYSTVRIILRSVIVQVSRACEKRSVSSCQYTGTDTYTNRAGLLTCSAGALNDWRGYKRRPLTFIDELI